MYFERTEAKESWQIMIRESSRPTAAHCTLAMYAGFLLSEPKSASCLRLSEIMKNSHDSVNRFLYRENYDGHDLFLASKRLLRLRGGTLSIDDTVLDKPYSQYMAFLGYFWSGKHHRSVKGINLITLYYTDIEGQHLPVNFRVYDKSEGKTKNDYFQEMLQDVLNWGLEPAFVTGDSWYSCVKNLKTVKNHHTGFLFALESNRLVAIEKGVCIQVQTLAIPNEGLLVWLREFGYVKVFRTQLKDQLRHYAVYLPDAEQLTAIDRQTFEKQHDNHWKIETYHRALKQVCNIERFQVRGKQAIQNHLFAALYGFVQLQISKVMDLINNVYQLQRNLFNEVIAFFIKGFIQGKETLNPQLQPIVNA